MMWRQESVKVSLNYRVEEVDLGSSSTVLVPWADSNRSSSTNSSRLHHSWGFRFPHGIQDEELESALALSLSQAEGQRRKKSLTGHNSWQINEDEDLARALQASLNFANGPFGLGPGSFWHGSSMKRICGGCKKELVSGRYLSFMGSLWHPQCFRCQACKEPINDREFSVSGDQPYHKACYRQLFHPRCDVCKQYIPASGGVIEYRIHPYWGQKYCPKHEYDNTPRCCSCERVQSKDAEYVSLEDKRKLCLECLDSAIMGTIECQPLFQEICHFYEGMNMRIKQEIPMALVERQALNEAVHGATDGHRFMPETRGLCLSEETIVNIVARRPIFQPTSLFFNVITTPMRVRGPSEVTAVLVLYGLPRLLTGSVLTHELMHAWLRLNEFQDLQPKVEEGICQVLAHMWLESHVMTVGSSSSNSSHSPTSKKFKDPALAAIERKLGEFFLYQIAKDPSSVYGEGFRLGYASMRRNGLERTLNHIRRTGNFL